MLLFLLALLPLPYACGWRAPGFAEETPQLLQLLGCAGRRRRCIVPGTAWWRRQIWHHLSRLQMRHCAGMRSHLGNAVLFLSVHMCAGSAVVQLWVGQPGQPPLNRSQSQKGSGATYWGKLQCVKQFVLAATGQSGIWTSSKMERQQTRKTYIFVGAQKLGFWRSSASRVLMPVSKLPLGLGQVLTSAHPPSDNSPLSTPPSSLICNKLMLTTRSTTSDSINCS